MPTANTNATTRVGNADIQFTKDWDPYKANLLRTALQNLIQFCNGVADRLNGDREPLISQSYTAGTLPDPGVYTKARAMITDAQAPVYLAPAAGGGALTAPVFSDGKIWRFG